MRKIKAVIGNQMTFGSFLKLGRIGMIIGIICIAAIAVAKYFDIICDAFQNFKEGFEEKWEEIKP